jgi:FtsP/CotA-like multicopper oxidase with cupredoxin domain
VIQVEARERWASFKFISAAFMKSLVVSIDEHPMWVYEVDGHYIEPRQVDDFPLFNGERYGVMIRLNKTPKNYTMRIADTNGDQIISGFSTLSYKGGKDTTPSKPYINYGGQNVSADVVQLDTKDLVPYPSIKPSKTSDQMFNLTMGRIESSWQWTMEGTQLWDVWANPDTPILFDLDARKNIGDKLTLMTQNGTWVDLLLQLGEFARTPEIQAPHVIHKHSNKAFWIGAGPDYFNWTSVEEAIEQAPEYFNLETPNYRDTFVTNGNHGPTWMVLRYEVVNPGPFLLHCHIETHLTAGMGVALLDGVDVWPEVPAQYDIQRTE